MTVGKFIKWAVAIVAIAGVAWWVHCCFFDADVKPMVLKTANAEVKNVVQTIDATGTVEPEDLVAVTARVSGEIKSFGNDVDGKEIDYTSTVKEGSVLALIDDEIPQSNLLSAKAKIDAASAAQATAKANLLVAEENLKQAVREWTRAKRLGVGDALSQSSYDAYLSAWEKATAQISVAKAQILSADAQYAQAQAGMREAQRNLEYCIIKAPVDGVIIDRKVNVGQTVVSSMSASSLFSIAKDLKKMEVWASVNEADIGGVKIGQPVTFTVDAFPKETFRGRVGRIRLNATMSQNVVTYVVEVVTDNSSGRLLPYLSANLNFEVARADNALAVPNGAFRWRPDESLLTDGADLEIPAGMRRLWVADGEKVRPVFVKTGVRDATHTQIITDKLKSGDEIVVGAEAVELERASSVSNPFMPKMPKRSSQKKNSTAK